MPTFNEMEKYIDKFAYDVVDDMSFEDLKERVEEDIRTKAKEQFRNNPDALLQEMLEYWNVDSSNEINPDDFKC